MANPTSWALTILIKQHAQNTSYLNDQILDLLGDLAVLVLEAFRHFAQLPLDLDLTCQNEEGQRHQTCPFHRRIIVGETAVKEVGVLVDQKFRRGTDTQFFNQDVKTNPLLAKLARQFDCTVYPARCIRLPDNRFRLVLEPEVELPRDEAGRIDVTATAQLLNDKVESWVREYPEQWLWYHDRWSRRKTVSERYREKNEKKNRRK